MGVFHLLIAKPKNLSFSNKHKSKSRNKFNKAYKGKSSKNKKGSNKYKKKMSD